MRVLALLTLAASAFLSGCQTSKPAIPAGQTGHITEVTVTKFAESLGTRNLAEDLRVKTLNKAYRFPANGPEKALKIHITGFEGVSPARALLVTSGTSFIRAEATLVDVATGRESEPMTVAAVNPRFGGVIGAAQSWGLDRIKDERSLASQLAELVIERVYGEELAIKSVAWPPRDVAVADFPFTYEEEALRLECDFVRIGNEAAIEDAREAGDDNPQLRPLPKGCKELYARG